MISRIAPLALLLALASPAHGDAPYVPADQGQRPQGTRILPAEFLRGFDPITVYFGSNVGSAHGAPADDGAKLMRIAPPWPGAYVWADAQTLQFRPAEPWPPLARFAVDAQGARKVLSTMMSAPSAMSPESGTDNLRPFRTLTLIFPQALPLESLKKMIRLEQRELPGVADSPRRKLEGWTLAPLPRGSQQEAAGYVITLADEVPEGKLLLVTVSLALGESGQVLWTGRLSTRLPFHLEELTCGSARFRVAGGGQASRDLALACGNHGEQPQLVFSAPVKDLTLTELKQLVRLEPAVPDLHFEGYGSRVTLRGKFVPDTLYRLRIGRSQIRDDADRVLADPGNVEVYFYLGWKSPFLRWSQSTAILEAEGPRMIPLVGYGDARADVRIYRIDPLFAGLWPFPASPLSIDEEAPPPFPGEEPAQPGGPQGFVDGPTLSQHLRLLGSPLVSKVVDLPRASQGATTRFGLDIGPLIDGAIGAHKPGTYLVGVRRLAGPPTRSYVRVQVTNLSVTTVEEPGKVVFFVRTLDRGEPVRGAEITLDGILRSNGHPVQARATTDAQGRAELQPQSDWNQLRRLTVASGDDVLVLDPREPPPRFADNHWSASEGWLNGLLASDARKPNDARLGFVFTERPIYRPGEPVFIKGYLRERKAGNLGLVHDGESYGLKVEGPDNQSWAFPVSFTPLGGFEATFHEKDLATGTYSASLFVKRTNEVVATRSFKIEAYRIPTFEVRFSGNTTVRLDQPFTLKALARYYAGGSVAGQPIAWTVTQRPYRYVPAGREGFLFASSTQFARPEAVRPPQAISRAAKLDDDGADSLTLNPALDVDGSARTYHFEATVTGPDDQPVTAVEDVRALPPFILGMRLPRYLEHAKELKPEILAIGVDGKPVAGQEVLVRLYRRVWHSHLRETNFSTGEAKYVTEQEDVKLKELTLKTATDVVRPQLPLSEAGIYVVELTGRDTLGRVQTLSADLYVGGPQPLAWQKPREGVLTVTTDQKSYAPGQTAHLVIQSPFQSGRALVVTEDPAGNRYSWVEVSGGKASFGVAIEGEHVPNLPVHVVLMRGRSGEPAAGGDGPRDDTRYRPTTVAASVELEVEPVRNRVLVGVSHPESARPGSKVDLTITLTDEKKQPLAGEVTLWLVDEAVLSLAREAPLDPLTAFIVRNQRLSSVRDTRNQVIGRLLEQEEPGGDGDEEQKEQGRQARTVRKNFKTVPFYQATLQVPASGKLVVPVTLSDDLTNFQVRAVAASGERRFGVHQSVLHVRLPVIVQPQLPRFVREGDHFFAGGIARLLEGAEGPGRVEVKLAGPTENAGGTQAIQLQSNKPASVKVPVAVKSGITAGAPSELTIRVDVTRTKDGVGDAFEVKLPVLPDRSPEHVAFMDTLAPGPWKPHPLSEPARAGTLEQSFTFSNQAGLLELAAGLDYLGDYPHGCLEQQISQLYPEIAQGVLLRKLGLLREPLSAPSAAHVRRFLADLPQFMDDEGLVAYWPGARGDPQMTAQLVDFLQDVKRSGLPVDAKLEARALEALRRTLRSNYPRLLAEFRYNQQSEAIRALARAGQLDEHYAIELFNRRADLDTTSMAALAQAMEGRPQLFGKDLLALKDDLWDTVVFRLYQGKPVFERINARRRSWGSGYLGDELSTTASVLRSLVELDPANPKLPLVRDALLASADPVRGWRNTYDNRLAIGALATYLDRAQEPVASATVKLGSQSLALDGAHKAVRTDVREDAPLGGSVQGGAVRARVAYSFIPSTPGDQVGATKQGFIVSRSMTLLRPGAGAAEHFDDHAGQTRTLQVGDVIEVHARVVADEEHDHVAIVVPFAAGLEPLNPELANVGSEARPSQPDSIRASYVQRLDHEVRYYFLHLPAGTHSFHFRVRAASEGSFVHPAPYAELMYREEVRGRGEGMRIVVNHAP